MKKVWIFGDSTSAENVAASLRYEQAWLHFLRDYLSENIEELKKSDYPLKNFLK